MSNKSRLQTNNTNLQELINKAENLPDAGSGGSGSAPTIVSGKCVPSISTSAPAATQTAVVTVEGLGFKPFCVMIGATSTVSVKDASKNYFITCQHADGTSPVRL